MRLRGYSEDVPKPMVTVGARPVLWHIMKYYAHFGHKDFILCLGYLLLFPFSSWGMTILIAIGAVILVIIGRPGEVITTSITTTVVMVVAGISPQHAWHQPILRLFDTLIGIAVGIAAAWIAKSLRNLNHFNESTLRTQQTQWSIMKETL